MFKCFSLLGQRSFSSTGLGLCHGAMSILHASVSVITFIFNILSETTHPNLMKFHRNVPAMVLLRFVFKQFDFFKNCGCNGNITKNIGNL